MRNNTTQEEKFIKMTQAPVKGLNIRMAVPTIISMLVTSIYNMADTFFVGHLDNTSATGAIGIVFPLMAIIQGVGFTFGQGSGNSMSRSLGMQDRAAAERMSATGFYSAFLAGILLAVSGLVFNASLMSLLFASNMMLQNIGSAFQASLLSMARQGFFFIPAILILPKLFGLFGL